MCLACVYIRLYPFVPFTWSRRQIKRFAQSCHKAICHPVADERLEPTEELRLLRREATDMKAALAVRAGVFSTFGPLENLVMNAVGTHTYVTVQLGGEMGGWGGIIKGSSSSTGRHRALLLTSVDNETTVVPDVARPSLAWIYGKPKPKRSPKSRFCCGGGTD